MALDPVLERASGRRDQNHGGISSDSWCSPPEVAVPLFDFWGWADCDPCSNERSIIKARKRYTEGGLIKPWLEQTYNNNPYSQNEVWADKAIHEMRVGHVAELVILCMTATSTRWWHRYMIEPRRNPRVILTKRLKFLGPGGKPVDSSRFEPALIYYGKRSAAFDRHFAHVAMWSAWGR